LDPPVKCFLLAAGLERRVETFKWVEGSAKKANDLADTRKNFGIDFRKR